MGLVDWQAGPNLLASILRRHGQALDAMTDTITVWTAFAEFAQTKLAGIDARPDSDADGFILQWGRWSWNNNRPSMSFIRQVAVPCEGDQSGDCVELWQIELVLFYEDSVMLSSHSDQTMGFYFPKHDEEWKAVLIRAGDFPPLLAVATMAPVGSSM
jgi:hypothetical protein